MSTAAPKPDNRIHSARLKVPVQLANDRILADLIANRLQEYGRFAG
jgi:hypothetical protein